MEENINSAALDKLFEVDGALYGTPSLVRMARLRASILHASAAWGSDADGHLIGALADEVERLREALRWALAELNGKTRYDNEAQRENAFAIAEAVLASVSFDQGAPLRTDKSDVAALIERVEAALDAGQRNVTVTLGWLDGYCAAEAAVRTALWEQPK